MLLEATQFAGTRGQQETCDLLLPSRNCKQRTAFEKQEHCIRRRLDRQRMFHLIGPPEELPRGVKGYDCARAILKSLAAADDPIDDHEDIVGRIAFAHDRAVAPITDRA